MILSDDENKEKITEKKQALKSDKKPLLGACSNYNEKNYETSIRPKNFDDYIGQSLIKKNLKIAIEASKKRNVTLDHLLFYGPAGLGKTTLATIIANELDKDIKITSAPSIERPETSSAF